MQAWVFDSPGNFRWTDVPAPEPGPGEVRIKVVASALNHVDVWLAESALNPPWPHVPGCDVTGVIESVGDGADSVAVGDEVLVDPTITCGRCPACLSGESAMCTSFGMLGDTRWGAHGEFVVVPATNVSPRPADRSWAECAALPTTTLTAWRLLRRAALKPTDTVLVVGVGGGVASSAMALAKWCGARVVASSRSAEKRERARALGADAVIDSAADRWDVQADIVVETIGAATWQQSTRALAPGGRLAVCGATSGQKVEVNLVRLWAKQQSIVGSTMGSHQEWAEVADMFRRGLPVYVDQTLGLDEFPTALERLTSGEQFGKLVLQH